LWWLGVVHGNPGEYQFPTETRRYRRDSGVSPKPVATSRGYRRISGNSALPLSLLFSILFRWLFQRCPPALAPQPLAKTSTSRSPPPPAEEPTVWCAHRSCSRKAQPRRFVVPSP